jgi:hypothetical protein
LLAWWTDLGFVRAGKREFIKLLISSPLLYYLGPHWTLLDEKYLIGKRIVFLEGFGETISGEGFLFFFIYNFVFYVVPFFVGLHFTYLDYFPFLQQIVITKYVLTLLKEIFFLLPCDFILILN